jgi:hypothetical protein
MRSFGLVDQKLEKADFFCDLVAEGGGNFLKVRHYFSAFVAAARSVTFSLQASIKDAEGFAEWYGDWQQRLRANKSARFFHACRTDNQHVGLNPVMGAHVSKNVGISIFGQPELGRYDWLPEEDVATACRANMKILCELISDCYRKFGLLIDPDQIYSPDGLNAKGWTLEDVEEQLGFPRGYTDIPWGGPDKAEQRLRLLRRQIPMSTIGGILAKYLDADTR